MADYAGDYRFTFIAYALSAWQAVDQICSHVITHQGDRLDLHGVFLHWFVLCLSGFSASSLLRKPIRCRVEQLQVLPLQASLFHLPSRSGTGTQKAHAEVSRIFLKSNVTMKAGPVLWRIPRYRLWLFLAIGLGAGRQRRSGWRVRLKLRSYCMCICSIIGSVCLVIVDLCFAVQTCRTPAMGSSDVIWKLRKAAVKGRGRRYLEHRRKGDTA